MNIFVRKPIPRAQPVLTGMLIVAALAGCGGGQSDGPDEVKQSACPDSTYAGGADSDSDGLSDPCELNVLKTSPLIADTDGDGLDDYKEVVERGFDPDSNNFLYNPLISDIPTVDIDVTSAPDIAINYTTTDSTSHTESTSAERSQSSSQTVEKTNSSSTSQSVEATNSAEVTTSVSVEHEFGITGGTTVSGSVESTVSYSQTTTNEQTVSWSRTQSSENSTTYSRALGYESTHGGSIEQSSGSLAVTVQVQNNGRRAFTVTNLALTATMIDPYSGNVLTPVGNLNLDGSYSSFPTFSLSNGESTGNINFTSEALDLDTAKSLLRDSSGLNIGVALYELEDINGASFAFTREEVLSKTAAVIIDPGLEGDRKIRRYRVATVGNPDSKKLSLRQLMDDVLQANYTLGGSGELSELEVGGYALQAAGSRFWTIVHDTSDEQGNRRIDRHDPTKEAYSFDELELKAGDTVHLVYIKDADEDGLGMRQEFAFGTSDSNGDSDGDGIKDGVEVYVYGLHPARTDSDGDGYLDPQERFVSVTAGRVHNLGVALDGSLWGWGENIFHQLGRGEDTQNHCVPVQVGTAYDWAEVFSSGYCSLALKEDGSLWGWGYQCPGVDATAPQQISTDDWKRFGIGFYQVLGIKTDGTLWAWGYNTYGQLGLGDTTDRTAPTQVGTDTDWATVDSGRHFSVALKEDGSLWAWGRNDQYQLGLGDNSGPETCSDDGGDYACSKAPVRIGTDTDWASIAAAEDNVLALKEDGTIWTWGYQIGGPQQVGSRSDWKNVFAGGLQIFMAIADDGTLWGWGSNVHGQLGLGDRVDRGEPNQVGSDADWAMVDMGYHGVIGLKYGYVPLTWGDNNYGQVGDGNCPSDRLTPGTVR